MGPEREMSLKKYKKPTLQTGKHADTRGKRKKLMLEERDAFCSKRKERRGCKRGMGGNSDWVSIKFCLLD